MPGLSFFAIKGAEFNVPQVLIIAAFGVIACIILVVFIIKDSKKWKKIK